MKAFAIVLAFLFIHASLAQVFNVTVSFDRVYDNANQSVNTVSCSQDLAASGFTKFGDIPNFPFMGGSFNVTGFDAPGCGTCWELSFTPTNKPSGKVAVLAIDHAGPETFNIAHQAMDMLTNNQADLYGRVNATAVRVAANECEVGSKKKVGLLGH